MARFDLMNIDAGGAEHGHAVPVSSGMQRQCKKRRLACIFGTLHESRMGFQKTTRA